MERGLVAPRALGRRQRFAHLNVAVAGRRLGRFDSDGHNRLPAAGEIKTIVQHLSKFLLLGDHVVGRQHGHDRGCGTRSRNGRSQRDGGAGVAADRLADDVLLWQFRKLFGHLRRLNLVGDHQNISQRHQWQHAVHGLLQKRLPSQQGDQLLGCLLPADRPEPLAAPAGHDDDVTVTHVGFGL